MLLGHKEVCVHFLLNLQAQFIKFILRFMYIAPLKINPDTLDTKNMKIKSKAVTRPSYSPTFKCVQISVELLKPSRLFRTFFANVLK